ncbi:unnamed protein product [Macrosiphum euphorbiae]|uniref:Uncharacterized protein n=1 Tax=Macrosiphum euphorbiae TaxID=13131 RepID=A0AAV0WN77_9HEMI|nr:unnamed protein product [Macrosiphum euphorbiae]
MNILQCTVGCRSLVLLVHENSDPEYPQYTSFLSRLKTFDSHPARSCQDKYSLAASGFTYTGTEDLVQCMEFIENVKNEFNLKRSDNRGIRDCCRCKSEPYDVGNNRDNGNSQARICKSESYDVVG